MNNLNKKFAGGGVILLIKNQEDRKEYIVLAKRTKNAPVYPDTHSCLFGGADNIEEERCPIKATQRELSEEILIYNEERNKSFSIDLSKIVNDSRGQYLLNADEVRKEGKELLSLWKGKLEEEGKKSKIQKCNDEIELLQPEFIDTLYYVDQDGQKEILVIKIEIPSLEKIILLDGERIEETNKLLDRKIDVFEFNTFHNWWISNESDTLTADFSFKIAKHSRRKGFVNRNKISPSFMIALNVYRRDKTKTKLIIYCDIRSIA